jgi:hypothetical protein
MLNVTVLTILLFHINYCQKRFINNICCKFYSLSATASPAAAALTAALNSEIANILPLIGNFLSFKSVPTAATAMEQTVNYL